MGRISSLAVRNYKSYGSWAELRFPPGRPLVIFGENNAGKTNLISALELVLGERWPGSHRPESHEFHGRSPEHAPVQVIVDVEDVHHSGRYGPRPVVQFHWSFPDDEDRQQPAFKMSFADGETTSYVSNATREQCFCLVIAADRRLNYQLSYASQWTFLAKLMRKFHEALVEDPDRVEELQSHFEGVKAIFRTVTEFRDFAEAVSKQVDDLSGSFEYQLTVDFSAYDPSNYFKSLKVFPSQDGVIRSFDELGTGQEQVLAIAFAWAYAQAFHGDGDGLVLVVEEPEAHLHPLAQRWLSRRLHELAADGLQIVVTTHSPAFLRVGNLEGLVRVHKPEAESKVVQHSLQTFVEHCQALGAPASVDTTVQRYEAWATEEILSGLFARACVLVEGPTEALALPRLLSRVGFDAEREGAAFISVGGVGDLAKWWRFFTAYEIPTYALFDRDEGEDRDGNKRRDLMRAAGIGTDEAEQVLSAAESYEHPSVTMLAPDYESVMTALFGDQYIALQDQARREHGLTGNQAKPLVARFVADQLELDGPGEQFLRRLAERLTALTRGPQEAG